MLRRVAAALGVVFLFVMVGAAPASAVEPPPPPVTPASSLPSWSGVYYNPNGLTPGSTAYNEWMAAQQAKLTAAGYGPPKPPITTQSLKPAASLPGLKPITAPSALTRVGGGGILAAAYLGGWALGNGGLALYGVATNSDPWSALCGDADEPGSVLADIQVGLNFGIAPACLAPVPVPNEDQPTSTVVTYGSSSASLLGYVNITQAWGYHVASCWSGVFPSSPWVMERNISGTWTGMSNTSAYAANCGAAYPSRTASVQDKYWQTSPGAFYNVSSGFRVRNQTTGAIIAPTITLLNPERLPGCQITWDDGTTTQAAGTAYHEQQSGGGIQMSAAGLGCSGAWSAKHPGGGYTGGVLPTRIKVTSNDGTTTTTISDQTVGPATSEQKSALANPALTGLVLIKTVSGVSDSCMDWTANCSGWWDATTSGTVPSTAGTTYSCYFGGSAVTLSECGIYRHTFDVRTSTPTITDPVTGTEQQWVTAPSTSTGGIVGSPSAPGNANSTDPSNSVTPGDACFASWPSAADPITWVMHPVYCAMVKAFVPREAVLEQAFADAEAAWADSAPVVLVGYVGDVLSWPSTSGCSVGVTMFGIEADVVNACEGPVSELATYSRIITSAYIGIAVFGKLRQQAAAMVNYNVGQT